MMQGEYFREYWRSQMETFHSYKKKSVNVVKESRFTSLNIKNKPFLYGVILILLVLS